MQIHPDEILDAALKLSESDRLAIATRLLDTLPEGATEPSDEDPAFLAELERRANDKSPRIPLSDIWTANLDP